MKPSDYVRTSVLLSSTLVRSGAVQACGMAVTLAVGVELARLLGPKGYGEYGIAFAALSLLGIPGEFGVSRLVTREAAKTHAQGDLARLPAVLRWAYRTASGASLSVLVLAAVFIVFRIRTPHWPPVYLALAIGLPLLFLNAITAIQVSALSGLQHIVRGQIPTLLIRPVIVATLLLPLFARPGLASPAIAMSINVLAAAAALLLASRWLRAEVPKTAHEAINTDCEGWLMSAFSIALIDGLRVIQGQLGVLLLGLLATSEQAGLYRLATSIGVLIAAPGTLIELVSSPKFARLFALDDIGGAQRLATRAAWLGTAAAVSAMAIVVLFGRPLIALLFGAAFLPAYIPLVILAAGYAASALFGMNSILLLMTGHERALGRDFLIAVAAAILCTAALVPSLGATGAALGNCVYLIVWNVLAWRSARTRLKVNSAVRFDFQGPFLG